MTGSDDVSGFDLIDPADDVSLPDGHMGDTIPGVCGDGVLEGAAEGCDDGNSESGDGCDPGCQVEPGWACDDAGCACDVGFFGPTCAPCTDCGGFGVCSDGLDGDGLCACEDGYQGDDCRSCAEGYAPVEGGPWTEGGSCMPNDECSDTYCSGNGLCVYPDEGPLECDCASGWEGDLCQDESAPQYVGSFNVSDGPSWSSNPATYTCLEACAQIFGGSANSYECSTNADSINNQAWLDGWGMGCHTASQSYKKNNPYDCGFGGCSESAYVMDHSCNNTNYCWQ